MNEKLKDFLLKNNLDEKIIYDFPAEIKIFLSNPDKYDLIYDGAIYVVLKKKIINPGVYFLQNNFFNKNYDIKDLDNDKYDTRKKFILECLKNNSIYLCGANGIGKTTLAIALANKRYQKNNVKTLYVSWPDFIEKCKDFKNNTNFLNEVKNANYVIIDDLGGESISKWSRDEILFSVINYRLEKNLNTIIISNYTQKELLNRYKINNEDDDKQTRSLVSKINGLTKPIDLAGRNYRNE